MIVVILGLASILGIGILLWLLSSIWQIQQVKDDDGVNTIVVLGSGGHTTEMIGLVQVIDRKKFSPRIYLMAEGDAISECKVKEADPKGKIVKIPRARRVGQSFLTTPWTTMMAAVSSLSVLLKTKPDLILCNGPGTCVPICVLAWIQSIVKLRRIRIVFVESVCRVETLSLSGKILIKIADAVLVQWPELADKYPRSKCLARFL